MGNINVKAGEVWYADMGAYDGHRQGGLRACLVVSNNINNQFAPTVNVIAFTSQSINKKTKYPQHAYFQAGECGLDKDSILLGESQFQLDKTRLIKKLGDMNEEQLCRAATAVAMQQPLLFKLAPQIIENVKFKSLVLA